MTGRAAHSSHLASMTPLTTAQQKVFEFVREILAGGQVAPTFREIASAMGYSSKRAAEVHVQAMVGAGYLAVETGKARSLRLGRAVQSHRGEVIRLPLLGTIPAGHGDDRRQEENEFITVSVETLGLRPTRNAFALLVKGDSMIGRHICDGDIVVLEHGPEPRSGQIVAALIDRKNTLKTFVLKNGRPYLKAENPKYPDLVPAEELVIQGVCTALVRKMKE